jgi:YidC/Oxa1 family membrane protein insertase
VSDESTEYNQRSMRAIILCVLVAILYTQFFLAPQQKAKQQQAAQLAQQQLATTPQAAVPAQAGAPGAALAPAAASGSAAAPSHPSLEELKQAPVSTVETGTATISVTHLGARISQYKVTNYRRELESSEFLDLIDSSPNGARPLGLYVGSESDDRVQYVLASVNGAAPQSQGVQLRVEPGTKTALEFKGALPSGIQVTKRITFTGGSYLLGVDVALDRPNPNNYPVLLEWTHYYSSEIEKELRIKHAMTLLDSADKVRHVQIDQIGEGAQLAGPNKWVALGDTYFASIIVPTLTSSTAIIGREGDVFFGRVSGSPTGGQFYSYVGPKDYRTLEMAGDFSLERSVDLGWFSFLALPLLWLLRALYALVGNWGVAIIGLTLVVKAVMLPLSKASFESAKKMQNLQPEIKALRERIKDPTQLNQEMFALYKRKGVNPMGGCFPVLIQIPVFLGLYNALLNALELRHAPYALWIKDLSAPENLQLFGIGIPVMVLLMAASMIYQTWTTPNPSADPTQQKMMMIMPVVFAGMFIVFPMPAGLVLYWLVNNIISIIQQLYMRSSEKGSVYVGTLVASVVIFGVGYLLTLI